MYLRLTGNGEVTARKKAVTLNKTPTCSITCAAVENPEPMNLATNIQEKETEIAKQSKAANTQLKGAEAETESDGRFLWLIRSKMLQQAWTS